MTEIATRLDILAGSADRNGRRTVRAVVNGDYELHRHNFNTDDANHREMFLESVRDKWTECPVDFNSLGQQIIAAAATADAMSGNASRAFVINKITAAELAATRYKIEFHVRNILVAGQPQCIFGAKKSLKTSLMLDQAISVATSTPFLGRFAVDKPARVGVFSGESGMPTIQDTCLRICFARNVRLEKTGIVFSDTLPMFGNLEHMSALEKYLRDEAITLAYFDPVYLCMLTGGNEGSLFAMGALLGSVRDVCQRAGCTPVLLHHNKKNVSDPYAPGDLDDAAWAGFGEFSRGWMLVNRREKYELGSGHHKLWLSVGGSVGYSSRWGVDISEGEYTGPGSRTWEVHVLRMVDVQNQAAQVQTTAKQQKLAGKLQADKQAILEAMADYPGGDTKTAIRSLLGMSGTVFGNALRKLVQEGKVVQCEVRKPGRKTPHDGYKLANNGAQTSYPDGATGPPGQSNGTDQSDG